MGEIKDSIDLLSDELLHVVVQDASTSDSDAPVRLLRNCPRSMSQIISGVTQRLRESCTAADVAVSFAIVFELGWRSREALAESEALERMTR
jgi:hypothetical protein